MKRLLLALLLAFPMAGHTAIKADAVIVEKSISKLFLMKNGEIIKAYHVAFGANPKGHKQQEGDQRTPEGKYILDYKKPDSAYYKAIHISYPNEQDKRRAAQAEVDPGGFIMIHGQKNNFGDLSDFTQKFNWTDGCIAVSNQEMDEIWSAIDEGTPIEINP